MLPIAFRNMVINAFTDSYLNVAATFWTDTQLASSRRAIIKCSCWC